MMVLTVVVVMLGVAFGLGLIYRRILRPGWFTDALREIRALPEAVERRRERRP